MLLYYLGPYGLQATKWEEEEAYKLDFTYQSLYLHPELFSVHLKAVYKNRVPAYIVRNSRKRMNTNVRMLCKMLTR